MPITSELRRITEDRATLTLDEAAAFMRRLLAGEGSDMELAALLGALAARGETAEEIAGFALALREVAVLLPLSEAERAELVDTCGTGGDGCGTFNISTAAALVAAAAGAKVAKHGNRAVTSRCGSADVLEALGVPTTLSSNAAAEALRRHGFCFLHAPSHHPAMRAVVPVRRALGVRTVFNVLGPLLNPGGAQRQLMGVYAARLVPVVAKAMTLLGLEHALVVHGEGGLDELSLSGPSVVAEVCTAGCGVEAKAYTLNPEDAGLASAPLSAQAGGDAPENAEILSAVLALNTGQPEQGPRRDIVLLNAGAVLVVGGLAQDLRAGVQQAAVAIDSGAVRTLVKALRSR